MPRSLLAPNPSPLTRDGTRTYLVGRRRVAVIDAGPALDVHLDAVAAAVGSGVTVEVLLTHLHADHSAGADELAARVGGRLRAIGLGSLADGERIVTDAGELVALATPGHSPDHAAFHWRDRAAVFCGDLMIGGQDTALVAAPEGDLDAYLGSLERLRGLAPRVIYPAHGPPFTDPPAALDAYVRHREQRRRQVLDALRGGAGTVPELVEVVYGPALESALRPAAAAAVVAYLEQLERGGRVRRLDAERWIVVQNRSR